MQEENIHRAGFFCRHSVVLVTVRGAHFPVGNDDPAVSVSKNTLDGKCVELYDDYDINHETIRVIDEYHLNHS